MGRSFDFITAEAKRIEAVLKVMLKLVFAKSPNVTLGCHEHNNSNHAKMVYKMLQ